MSNLFCKFHVFSECIFNFFSFFSQICQTFRVCQKKVILQTFIFTEISLWIIDLFKHTSFLKSRLFRSQLCCNEANDHQNAIVLTRRSSQQKKVEFRFDHGSNNHSDTDTDDHNRLRLLQNVSHFTCLFT